MEKHMRDVKRGDVLMHQGTKFVAVEDANEGCVFATTPDIFERKPNPPYGYTEGCYIQFDASSLIQVIDHIKCNGMCYDLKRGFEIGAGFNEDC